ncbi:unnamed protein product [Mytilus edulis]|uniref:Uncharacterized protein n=1 Tax=Mytilus edulis TaxID=6550 RepID=A0A8S3VC71_MYTED|nr:unnamed protein product [Mytilus edulis]
MERVYDLYIGNDTSVLTKQEAASSSSRVKQHFKSDIINYWEYFNIEQVKISVNTKGTEEAYFIFNGTETNKTNWFSTDRILRSSYTGLTSNTTKLYFSNLGHELEHSQHMLFLIAEYDRDDILQPKMLVLDAKRQKNVIVFFPLNFGPCTIEYDEENVSRTTITTESTNIVYTSAKEEINNTQDRIEKLKKVLHVDPKSTSNYKRSLISVYESRISAVSIGTVAISVILSIFGTVIAIDVVTNSKHIKKFVIRKYRLCRSFKFKMMNSNLKNNRI